MRKHIKRHSPRQRLRLQFCGLALAIALAGCNLAASPVSTVLGNKDVACDRACLKDVAEAFLEAKTYNDTASLEVTETVRVTMNGKQVELGQGETWSPGLTIVNRYTAVDLRTGTSIVFATLAGTPPEGNERRQWWHYAVRLSVDAQGRLSEIEAHANDGGFATADTLAVPFREAAIFNAVLPEAERRSAVEMIAAADAYWDGLSTGDGARVPFGPDCQRTEFGSYSTNSPWTHSRNGGPDYVPKPQIGRSCRTFFDGPRFRWPTDNRRYYIVDEARGVVVAVGQLNKFGDDGIPGLTLTEAFKIVDGRIEFLWAPAFQWGVEDSGWPDWERPK